MLSELDLKELWKELDEYEKELQEESVSLQNIWVKIAELKTKNELDLESINVAPEFDFLSLDSKFSLNVGGHIFETTVEILTRDPNSILAAICRKSPPVSIGVDFQTYYFDRDWWLFRHILIYLKSNILPNELETLKELHTEASFFRLESLQKAIEDIPLSQISDKEPPHLIST